MKATNGFSYGLVGMGMAMMAYADSTVVQTATSIIPGSTTQSSSTATPTPTYSSSSSTCVGWECGSTSCIPSTTSLLYYLCEPTCLNSRTITYTETTYPPPITQTLPCNGKFAKKDEVEDVEKRWTCVPGPTITSYTSMACSDCHQFPTLTTTTSSVVSTVYQSCSTVVTYPSSTPTKTSSTKTSTTKSTPTKPTKTPKTTSTTKTVTSTSSFTRAPPACWYTCSGPAGYTTIPYSGTSLSATPTGYKWCALACT